LKPAKLIDHLIQLTKKEQKWLRQLLQSPYLFSNPALLPLFETLLLEEKALKKRSAEELFAHVCPELPFKKQKWYDLLSELNAAVEYMWADQHLQEESTTSKLAVLNAMADRNLGRSFWIKQKSIQKEMEKLPKDAGYYQQQFALNGIADDFVMQQEVRSESPYLQHKMDALDVFYCASKLKDACAMLNRSRIVATEYEASFLSEVLAIVENNSARFKTIDCVWVYYIIYKMLSEKSLVHFEDLMDLLRAKAASFSQSESRGLFQYALNFCIAQINSGQPEYLNKIFGVYQLQIEKDLLLENGLLNQWNYKNIITTGIRLEEWEWTRAFLEEQKVHLHSTHRNNAYTYNLANYFYETNAFSKALKLLQAVVYTDPYYNLAGRSLLLRIYFEKDDVEALDAQLQSFRIFLARSRQLSSYQKEVNLNFVRMTKKAQKLRELYVPSKTLEQASKIDALKTQLFKQPMVHREWLVKQLEQLPVQFNN